MLWFIAPVLLVAGKLIYDAANDYGSSSSSSSYSDNSAEIEQRERQREQQQAQKQQRLRKKKQLKQQLNVELNKLNTQYLAQPLVLDASGHGVARHFCDQVINDEHTAKEALGLLTAGDIKLKPAINKHKKIAIQTAIDELRQLKKMLNEV